MKNEIDLLRYIWNLCSSFCNFCVKGNHRVSLMYTGTVHNFSAFIHETTLGTVARLDVGVTSCFLSKKKCDCSLSHYLSHVQRNMVARFIRWTMSDRNVRILGDGKSRRDVKFLLYEQRERRVARVSSRKARATKSQWFPGRLPGVSAKRKRVHGRRREGLPRWLRFSRVSRRGEGQLAKSRVRESIE